MNYLIGIDISCSVATYLPLIKDEIERLISPLCSRKNKVSIVSFSNKVYPHKFGLFKNEMFTQNVSMLTKEIRKIKSVSGTLILSAIARCCEMIGEENGILIIITDGVMSSPREVERREKDIKRIQTFNIPIFIIGLLGASGRGDELLSKIATKYYPLPSDLSKGHLRHIFNLLLEDLELLSLQKFETIREEKEETEKKTEEILIEETKEMKEEKGGGSPYLDFLIEGRSEVISFMKKEFGTTDDRQDISPTIQVTADSMLAILWRRHTTAFILWVPRKEKREFVIGIARGVPEDRCKRLNLNYERVKNIFSPQKENQKEKEFEKFNPQQEFGENSLPMWKWGLHFCFYNQEKIGGVISIIFSSGIEKLFPHEKEFLRDLKNIYSSKLPEILKARITRKIYNIPHKMEVPVRYENVCFLREEAAYLRIKKELIEKHPECIGKFVIVKDGEIKKDSEGKILFFKEEKEITEELRKEWPFLIQKV